MVSQMVRFHSFFTAKYICATSSLPIHLFIGAIHLFTVKVIIDRFVRFVVTAILSIVLIVFIVLPCSFFILLLSCVVGWWLSTVVFGFLSFYFLHIFCRLLVYGYHVLRRQHVFTYMCNLKNKVNEQTKQKQTHRYREQSGGCQRDRGLWGWV